MKRIDKNLKNLKNFNFKISIGKIDGKNLSEEEKRKWGFVSLGTSPEILKEIIEKEGLFVAKEGNKLIGYLIVMEVETAKNVPFFGPLINYIQNIKINNKYLSDYKYCIIAQICISKEFRGSGLLEKLYSYIKNKLSTKYEIGVGEINAINFRSLAAHINKIGFKVIGEYSFQNEKWYVVYLNLKDINNS
jgi:hypothetical protein